MEFFPWVLARFLAWIIDTIVAALAARRRTESKTSLDFSWGSLRVKWSKAEKFTDT